MEGQMYSEFLLKDIAKSSAKQSWLSSLLDSFDGDIAVLKEPWLVQT
ncbi:MAG: hypothetical protein IPI78_18045 [Chitinophagaceae bacterium]|nr:hypothetical protein [Chitinophagaceae bacterium]